MTRALDHDDYRDLCAAHALGSLDPPDAARLEEHLRDGCEACGAELVRHHAAVEGLASLVEPIAPPAGAQQRLLTRIAVETGDEMAAMAPARRRSVPAATRWLLPAAALVLIGAALWSAVASRQEVRRLTGALQDFETTTDPLVRTWALRGSEFAPGARAMATHDPRTGLWRLFTHDLEPAPPGRSYQAWFVTTDGPIRFGIFQTDETQHGFVRLSSAGVNGLTEIRVTVEPAGGSEQPSGDAVLSGPATLSD